MKHEKSKRMAELYIKYLNSNLYTLDDCYKEYSYEKGNIFFENELVMLTMRGYNPKIVAYNTQFFSYAFLVVLDNKEAFVYMGTKQTKFIFVDEIFKIIQKGDIDFG